MTDLDPPWVTGAGQLDRWGGYLIAGTKVLSHHVAAIKAAAIRPTTETSRYPGGLRVD